MPAPPADARLQVRFAASTHVGKKRAHNEDSHALAPASHLGIVADGMGGHAAGEVASRMAVDAMLEYFALTEGETPRTFPFRAGQGPRWAENRLVTAVKLANARIWETAQARAAEHGMGTTLVAIAFVPGAAVGAGPGALALVAHVGDSRAYRLREGALVQLTEDHSLITDFMKLKGLTAEELTNFPQKNVIVRALGMKEAVQVDVRHEEPRTGDVYLLCSDGLTGMVEDDEIARIVLAETDLDRACERLVAAANDHGGTDNITVLLARVEAS